MAKNKKMAPSGTSIWQKLTISTVALLALGIGYSRYSISTMKRTSQAGTIYSQKFTGQGFAFKLIKPPDSKQKEPKGTLEAWLYPGASGAFQNKSGSAPLHIHWADDEEFEALEGTLAYYFDGEEGILEAGQKRLLPAGKVHTFWNAQPDQVLHLQLTSVDGKGHPTPSERFFQQWASAAYDYGGLDKVNPLQMILMLKAGDIELAGPYPLRLFVRYVACPFAQLLGYKGTYPEYVYE